MLIKLFIFIGLMMPDPKLLEAYKMAQQMDQQRIEEEESQKRAEVDNFLNTIGMIESSGGQNFDHDLIKSGIHKGHKAAGTYGLMPNTVTETLNRMRQSGVSSPELESLRGLDPSSVKQTLESNPEIEKQLAEFMARRALDRQGTPEKAAYSWFQGHNLTPEEIEARKYQDHDYVKKFRKYSEGK
jgi:hypothetical protein